MSKFTIEVHDDVSVAPLAKALAAVGYRLKNCGPVMELTETDERKAETVAAHAASERTRQQFLERGWEP